MPGHGRRKYGSAFLHSQGVSDGVGGCSPSGAGGSGSARAIGWGAGASDTGGSANGAASASSAGSSGKDGASAGAAWTSNSVSGAGVVWTMGVVRGVALSATSHSQQSLHLEHFSQIWLSHASLVHRTQIRVEGSSQMLHWNGIEWLSFPDRKSTRLNSSHRCISY